MAEPAAGPRDRARVGRLAASLLGVALAGVALISALAIWHLVRRGRLIRERLGQPRDVRWPEGHPPSPPRPSDEPLPPRTPR